MKNSRRWLKIFVSQIHTTKSIIVKDIDNLVPSNLGRDHQSQLTRIVKPGRVILAAPDNRMFRPSQVKRDRRLNCVRCPFMKLLTPFSQTCGEDVVVPTIKLLWVTLLPRLLLLIPLSILLIVTTLVTVALKPGT